ncbi:unnamed protein product, partial [Meganyctiphanes norvegica]
KDTNMRRSIAPEERLAITLRYLATGCSFRDLHYSFRIGHNTAYGIVFDVCDKIWRHLHERLIPVLTQQDWLNIAEDFKIRNNFLNCLGAIDGKHIRLIKPYGTGSEYFNYKKYFSMVLLAVCDSNYRFTFVDIGSYGKSCDSAIYKHSVLFEKLNAKTLNIPDSRPISTGGEPLPFAFVGDEAFGLSANMLRPYGGKFLTKDKKIFNYRLSRARGCIEQAFGILTNKWRILHRALNVNVDNADAITRACVILHNFVRERDGGKFEQADLNHGLDAGVPLHQPGGTRPAHTIRQKFADYYSSAEGSVPWQDERIWH